MGDELVKKGQKKSSREEITVVEQCLESQGRGNIKQDPSSSGVKG